MRLSQAVGAEQSRVLVSQAFSSATNFLPFGAGAIWLDASEMGSLAVSFTPFLLVLGTVRAVVAEPLLLASDARSERAGIVALLFGGIGSAAVIIVSAGAGLASWPIAAALPLVCIQDVSRYHAFSVGRAKLAVFSDSIWFGVQVVVLVVYLLLNIPIDSLVVGFSVLCGATASVLPFGRNSAAIFRHPFQLSIRDISGASRGLFLEFVAGRAIGELLVPLSALTISLEFAGALRLAQQILGPVNIFQSAQRIDATKRSFVIDDPESALERYGRRSSVTLIIYAGVLIVFSPVLSSTFSSAWVYCWPILAALFVEKLLELRGARYALGMRISGRSSKLGAARLILGSLLIVTTIPASILAGPAGFYACLIFNGFAGWICFHALRVELSVKTFGLEELRVAGVDRVLVLGGSVAAGFGIAAGKSYGDRIAAELGVPIAKFASPSRMIGDNINALPEARPQRGDLVLVQHGLGEGLWRPRLHSPLTLGRARVPGGLDPAPVRTSKGWRAVVRQRAKWVARTSYKWLLLVLGQCERWYSAERYERDLCMLLRKLIVADVTRIVVVGPVRMRGAWFPLGDITLRKFGGVTRQVALREGTPFVNPRDLLSHRLYCADGFHPSANGHAVIAHEILRSAATGERK